MQSILVLASTYPRWKSDTEPMFVHYLCKQIAREYRVIAPVPHYAGASRYEDMDGILVHRFRYFLPPRRMSCLQNELAESVTLRRQMGEYNRARVEEKFTLQRMVNEYRKLFEEAWVITDTVQEPLVYDCFAKTGTVNQENSMTAWKPSNTALQV